ncbi:MAG: AbrB/MazE/SpoVT family DNA-binding domain-containing protein [Candidatus Omnitrophica bacterium]|nr:AbrB/MazE/SpoVT family DNA-binding domain-containing protein [Candidatus Omnitrophota bacterium]
MDQLKAKIFKNGGSQAIRLPKDCRFPEGQTEVSVRKEGSKIILEPADEWPEDFKRNLGSLKEEIPRIKQTPITALRNPFEDWKD